MPPCSKTLQMVPNPCHIRLWILVGMHLWWLQGFKGRVVRSSWAQEWQSHWKRRFHPRSKVLSHAWSTLADAVQDLMYGCLLFVWAVAGNLVSEDDIHLVMEYKKGSQWGPYVSPRANRWVHWHPALLVYLGKMWCRSLAGLLSTMIAVILPWVPWIILLLSWFLFRQLCLWWEVYKCWTTSLLCQVSPSDCLNTV